MNDAGLPQTSEELSVSSEQLSEFSSAPVDDIPAAVREEAENRSRFKWQPRMVFWGLGGLVILALLGVPLMLWQTRLQSSSAQVQASPAPVPSETLTATQSPTASPENPADTLLGHLPYEEAPASELVAVGNGSITLRQPAAEKFEAMVAAAKADGVNLVSLSGFRSIDQQEDVFFEVKAERGENATTRAEVSAPPGYSEHHTGYAVDVGDGYFPDADLKESFQDTPAFKWLQENAGYYNFEISFPKDNAQGVNYEPWHWRFVGDRGSLETFYRARGTTGQPSPASSSSSPTLTVGR